MRLPFPSVVLLVGFRSRVAFPQIKIGPLPDSSLVPIPVTVPGGTLFGGGIAGYFAGIRVSDATEVEIAGVIGMIRSPGRPISVSPLPPPVFSPSPLGSPSNNLTSVTFFFTTWFKAPIPTNSGTNPPTLTPFNVMVHVKGTNQGSAANSDTDFTIFAGPIFHAPGTMTVNPT